MKRRQFLLNSLVAPTAFDFQPEALPERPLKGIATKDGATRTTGKIVVAEAPINFKLVSQDTDGDLSVFISSNNRKGSGPPLHVHQQVDEFFCVLEGEFLFQVGEEKTVLSPGDTLFVPRKVTHGFDCVSDNPGKLLVTMQPARQMEEFFRQLGQVFAKPGPPDVAAIQKIYQTHDSAIVGPSVTPK